MNPLRHVRAVCFDWGGTLMSEQGPEDLPMGEWPEVQAIEGAAECLETLAGRLPLAIATNASVSRRPMIELALSRVGFKNYFSHIFCFTELGFRKSQPEFWQAVERNLGVPLENVAMIGDSYEQDAMYPRRFGVQGVWFNHRGSVERDEVRVPVVDELSTFARWASSAA
ncbi:HAD family hydrolase [Sorangium sp. So ce375]|uniref:HAD family hydrolase n=1 Tax=Sorangium sp. So ce375 TaxID=3133306 RepID=UPI003F5C5E5C